MTYVVIAKSNVIPRMVREDQTRTKQSMISCGEDGLLRIAPE